MKPITIKIEEINETVFLGEDNSAWKKHIGDKIYVSSEYYELSIEDRETLLSMMKKWATEELSKVSKIKTNNRSTTVL
jgi:hypothetical protein